MTLPPSTWPLCGAFLGASAPPRTRRVEDEPSHFKFSRSFLPFHIFHSSHINMSEVQPLEPSPVPSSPSPNSQEQDPALPPPPADGVPSQTKKRRPPHEERPLTSSEFTTSKSGVYTKVGPSTTRPRREVALTPARDTIVDLRGRRDAVAQRTPSTLMAQGSSAEDLPRRPTSNPPLPATLERVPQASQPAHAHVPFYFRDDARLPRAFLGTGSRRFHPDTATSLWVSLLGTGGII